MDQSVRQTIVQMISQFGFQFTAVAGLIIAPSIASILMPINGLLRLIVVLLLPFGNRLDRHRSLAAA